MPILLPTDDLRLKEEAEYQAYLEEQEYQAYLESQGEESRISLIPSTDPRTQEGTRQPTLKELQYTSCLLYTSPSPRDRS